MSQNLSCIIASEHGKYSMANITELVCNVNEIVYVGDRFEFNRVSLTALEVNAIMEQRNRVDI